MQSRALGVQLAAALDERRQLFSAVDDVERLGRLRQTERGERAQRIVPEAQLLVEVDVADRAQLVDTRDGEPRRDASVIQK